MRRIVLLAALAILTVSTTATPASAVTCEISPQSVSFGSYDTLSAQPVDGVGNISVRCDAEASFSISLGSGSGTFSARVMPSGANVLEYNLYTDPSRLTVWGDGTSGTSTVSGAAATADVAVYGRIPARQNVPAGTYSDVVVVTLTY